MVKPKKRRHNTRRVKRCNSYTLQEIAALFGVHKSTIRGWCKKGLPTIDRIKPLLVHGGDLIAFLKTQQAGRKRPLTPEQFYCLKCRAPRLPMWNMVDCIPVGEKRLMLSALCTVCEAVMYRVGSRRLFAHYAAFFVLHSPKPKDT